MTHRKLSEHGKFGKSCPGNTKWMKKDLVDLSSSSDSKCELYEPLPEKA